MREVKVRRSILSSKNGIVWVAIIPAVIFFIVFRYGVMAYAFYLSLHKWNMGNLLAVGLGNYVRVLTEDPLFYKSLGNTFYYAMVVIPLGTLLALLIAIAVNQLDTIGKVFRAIYFIPVVVSMVAVAVVWKWLYQPTFGLINFIIQALGGPRIMWLQSPYAAMPAVMIASIWRGLGYTLIIFLAGLQGIPRVFYEAAIIDGANRWQLFVRITLPLLKPTVTFVLVIGVIGSLQVFAPMYVLAQGSGPLNSTRTIVVHLYERAFTYFEMGYGSAAAFVLFIIILILTMVQLYLLRMKWEY